MKRFLMIVALLAFCVMPTLVHAEAGYDGGFFMQNDEKTFKLKMGGRVQTKVFWERNPVNDPKDRISFQLRRALLGMSATIHEIGHVGFALMHATSTVGETQFQTVQVVGATAAIDIIPEFTVEVGMVGLPLDLMGNTSSKWFLLNEAPITSRQVDGGELVDATTGQIVQSPSRPEFGAPAGLGLRMYGGYWKWFYDVGIVNATEDDYTINNNKRFSFGMRTGVNILGAVPGSMTDFACSTTPQLTISIGSDYQNRKAPETFDQTIGGITLTENLQVDYQWTSSLGVALRWAGFAFTTEGYYRWTKWRQIPTFFIEQRRKLTDIGYYAAAGYYIIPKKFEIAAQAGQVIRQGPDNDAWQFGGGLNYYIFGNNMKLQLDYTFTTDYDDIFGTTNNHKHMLALMASAIF